MASSLSFFSSPPHPTPNPWPRAQSTFFTPQHSTKHTRVNIFAPTSPSPLRTSRNANLMSSPLQGGERHKQQSDAAGEGDENMIMMATVPVTSATHQDLSFNPFLASTAESTFATPSTSATDTTAPLFSFNAHPESSTTRTQPQSLQDRAVQFQFSARARSSSPSALLQSHTKDNRDSRKRLFLDRLRSRRDDARSDKAGDQVMRMDFIRERKMWETEKARSENVDVDVDVDEMVDLEIEDEQLSPTEEREVEELARQFYLQNQATDTTSQPGLGIEEFSDDGYEEAFMEVLSQEVPDSARQMGHEFDSLDSHVQSGVQFRPSVSVPVPDSEMDMS